MPELSDDERERMRLDVAVWLMLRKEVDEPGQRMRGRIVAQAAGEPGRTVAAGVKAKGVG